MTTPLYLGIDIAGASNTWATALASSSEGLHIVFPPRPMRLAEIVAYCDEHDVVAVAIDAQLTMALSEETGFRSSDKQLRSMLPSGCREWVASINSLMAVPVRGRMIAEALGPVVGTIIETHPRASLFFALGKEDLEMIRGYKKAAESAAMVGELWKRWRERYRIGGCDTVLHDGALDALICATVAYLFHYNPSLLLRLRHDAHDRTGRGPFYVIAPNRKEGSMHHDIQSETS